MIEAILISGRTIDQGATLEEKTSQAYFDAAAYCELNEKNLEALGLSVDQNVLVTTAHGTVVVPAKIDKRLPDDIIFIPMGPWANAVVDPDTCGCGMPGLKGIPATVEATTDPALSMKELMATYKE
ncbi:MAG: molybdopterin dinucleotide binding domain-containing protein [Candidatus Thorarchaeota archaeon]|nr:tRNA CCA-pyrophosphorylase [Methanosarcinales archaeon]RLG22564.1 MAG: tRNA CCA-pyrophosphorylase [Methanosarcinales archaeon]